MTKEKESRFEKFKRGIEFINDLIFPQISKRTAEYIENVEEKAQKAKKKIVDEMKATIVLGIAFLFFMFAGYYALREYVAINRTISCLTIGGVMLLLGLYLKVKVLTRK